MSEADRITREVEAFATDPYDRDVARAILNQSRQRGGISDVQVAHLLAIGYRSGYREGLTDARPLPTPQQPVAWWRRWFR